MPQPSIHLAIPTSQNTAPVLSFRCLYTHDLRRKAKRWQDGVLRFHTFNKRVMVYDEPRNFIGDTHWRESDTIQDGDELELEKGVLIQVSEIIERTETDLSELLEKRTAKPTICGKEPHQQDKTIIQELVASSQTSNTPHGISERSNIPPLTQLRPKSLNALLGTPRGPNGRATLPTKSPADLRKEKENGHSLSDRPAKQPDVHPPLPLDRDVPKHKIYNSKIDKLGRVGPAKNGHECRPESFEARKPQHPQKRLEDASIGSVCIDDAVSPEDPRYGEPKPQQLLRIVARKPRKKLMYRDLLPQKAPPHLAVLLPEKCTISDQKQQTNNSITSSSLDGFHDAQEARLHCRLLRRTESKQISTYPTPTLLDKVNEDSEEDIPERINDLIQNNDPMPPSSEPLFLTQSSPPKRTPTPESRSRCDLAEPPITSTNDKFTSSASPLPLDETIITYHPPKIPARTSISALSPLQRSLSDLNPIAALPSALTEIPPFPQHHPRRRKSLSNPPQTHTCTTNAPPPPPIRTSNLYYAPPPSEHQTIIPAENRPGSAKEQVAEPWSREAWDLFGFEGEDKSVGTENGSGWRRGGGGDRGGGLGMYGSAENMASGGWPESQGWV
ncbi:MAG: hypothetical protein Q9220_000349 [cf. Caloplaca sp. 1 TL-2023]